MPWTQSVLPLSLALLAGAALTLAAKPSKGPERPVYPKPPRGTQVDHYHGTEVADPFRSLEDPDAPETRKWVKAENAVTEKFLSGIPERTLLRKRLRDLWSYESWGVPVREGRRLFFTRHDGSSNQPRLYVREGKEAAPRLLLDPNLLAKDGTVALAFWSVSRDGRHLAWGATNAGSDWTEWRVRDVVTGRDGPDLLRWVKFSSASWAKDGSGFYYARYDEPGAGPERAAALKNQKLYFHRVGTPQDDDDLVYSRPDAPELGFEPIVSDDGRYLVLHVWRGTDRRTRLYYQDLGERPRTMVRLLDGFDALYEFLGNDGPVFYLRTDKDAPRGKVVAVDTRLAAEGKPAVRTLVAEGTESIEGARLVGGRIVLLVMKDATHRVRLHALDGTFERELLLPGAGTVSGLTGRRDDGETFYAFTSFTSPPTVYRFDFAAGTSSVVHQPKVPFDPSLYETLELFVTSRDETKVPVFLVQRKGLERDGTHEALLTGYGGFGIAMTPSFSPATIAWLERGGVFAQACLRGGSEYGEEWHRAGMLEKRQNVFDDFIAAAEGLIEAKVTSAPKLGISGASNGGLLVGVVLNQRPELFGGAIAAVGVMDMLRFHRFTIGWGWTSEYGSPEKEGDFQVLRAYSPLHNLKKGRAYPAVLVTTGEHDDRVVPGHSLKYAAALQEAQGGDAPVLLRVETRAGHGAGKPRSLQVDEAADSLAFLTEALRRKSTP